MIDLPSILKQNALQNVSMKIAVLIFIKPFLIIISRCVFYFMDEPIFGLDVLLGFKMKDYKKQNT